MPVPLAVAAAAAGRAAAGKVAQATASRAAQGAAGQEVAAVRSGKAATSGPGAVEARGSEFFKTERTAEQNINRRVDELRKKRWGKEGRQEFLDTAANDNLDAANDDEVLEEQMMRTEAEEESRAYSDIARMLQEQGEEMTSEYAAQLKVETQKDRPHFPVFIFSLALIKDVLDLPLNLTVVAVFFASILGVIASLTIAFWMLGKMNGAWYKRGMIKWFWRRFALVAIIEFIPGLQLIPANMILVWMAHNRENKAVQLLNQSLEILHSRGFGPKR